MTALLRALAATLLLVVYLGGVHASQLKPPGTKSGAGDSANLFESAQKHKACNFFVWNFVSAGLHSVCQRLCKDCTYEGKGGRKYVRIPPGSVLQLFYPCDQYSPDSCLLCGGNQEDHFTLAWSKRHLYTPIDLYLDKVKNMAESVQVNKIWKNSPPDIKTTYGFHKRYVLDLGALFDGAKNERQQKRLIQDAAKERYQSKSIEVKRSFGISYVVPKGNESFLRLIVNTQLDRLLQLQAYDNAVTELSKYGEFTKRRARRIHDRLEQQRFN